MLVEIKFLDGSKLIRTVKKINYEDGGATLRLFHLSGTTTAYNTNYIQGVIEHDKQK